MIERILALFLLLPHPVVTTAYSTESSGGVARWTGEPPVLGVTVACPVEWRGDVVWIEGVGVRVCEDTGKYDYWVSGEICGGCLSEYDGSPHIDIFMPHQEALVWGVQPRLVWRLAKALSEENSYEHDRHDETTPVH